MAYKMLVDLDRCVGCWTCAMACKVGNHLADDEYRIEVETLGSGKGIDRPTGVYPNLRMTWQPVYLKGCTFCAPRVAEGSVPFCASCCPTTALAFGAADDAESDFAKALERVESKEARVFELDAEKGTREGIVYASAR